MKAVLASIALTIVILLLVVVIPPRVAAQNSTATQFLSPNERIGTAVAQTLTQQAIIRASVTPTRTAAPLATATVFEISEQDIETAAAATIAALISATPSPTATSQFWQTETAVARSIGTFNDLFGETNWFCIPNARNSIGVKQLPSNYVVPPEMIHPCKRSSIFPWRAYR